jgi:hypothetical protein
MTQIEQQPLCWVQRETMLNWLDPEHPRTWRVAELRLALAPFVPTPEVLRTAIEGLAERGCVEDAGMTVQASRCARCLDWLGLVCP